MAGGLGSIPRHPPPSFRPRSPIPRDLRRRLQIRCRGFCRTSHWDHLARLLDMAPPMVRNPLIQLFQGCPATTSSREHEVKVDSMTGIRPPVSPSGKGSPCAPGDEARHGIMDPSGTHAASPHLSAYVHAYMDGLVPRGTSILGYSGSRAALCRPGTDAMVAKGEFPPK